jgi:hypothetical protein
MKLLWVSFFMLLTTMVPSETVRFHSGEYCYISQEAEYTRDVDTLYPKLGLFSYFPEGETPLRPIVFHSDQVDRGDVLQVVVFNERPLERVEAVLSDAEGNTVVAAHGGHLLPEQHNRDLWAAAETDVTPGYSSTLRQVWLLFVGIPHYIGGGAYRLEIAGQGGNCSFRDFYRLTVHPKEFAFENIRFNQDLSALMLTDDPRRLKESRELQDILHTFKPEAQYHTGPLILPVKTGRQSSGYGDRRRYHYNDGGSSLSLHNGIDLAVPTGTPVLASGSGEVVFAAERLITGYTVVLEHLPGVFSLYYHLDELHAEVGTRVDQGDILGTVGMTGVATGPHLHWELRVSGVAVDPKPFLEDEIIDKSVPMSIIVMRSLNLLRRRR